MAIKEFAVVEVYRAKWKAVSLIELLLLAGQLPLQAEAGTITPQANQNVAMQFPYGVARLHATKWAFLSAHRS